MFHNKIHPSIQCEYSSTWFSNLCPHFLKICREKVSANHEDANMYLDEFVTILNERCKTERTYNENVTSLSWTYTMNQDWKGSLNSMERLDFACFSAPSTHNRKLVIIRKSKNPREFKHQRSPSGSLTLPQL